MADQPRMQPEKVQKFKPPLETDGEKEAAAALKAELEMELQSIKQCAYKAFECTQLSLEGYGYCLRHILHDKNAPYKQCAYVYNCNGKRCHLPAPKDKKDSIGYCNEHALKTHLTSSKRSNRCQPPRTAEVMVHSVSHYVKKPRVRTLSSSKQYADEGLAADDSDSITTKCLDPFVDIDANMVLASGSDVLDMCSDSESDLDPTTYGSVWQDSHADSSDNESIDSEQEDVLKHANVYSAEEVTLITRDKLIRLQSLYIDQFRYLTHMLRERRRKYLYTLKREKETCCSIYNQLHDAPKEQRLYKKLKAYNSYHKKHGMEAVCHKRLHERRIKVTEGVHLKPPAFSKCVFTEGGVKCGERALPVTRHCRKHILEDPNQVLFRACGKMGGDIECNTPVEAVFDDATCRLHMDIPPIRSYTQVRKDSESDYEEPHDPNVPSTSRKEPFKYIGMVKTERYPDIKDELADLSNTDVEMTLAGGNSASSLSQAVLLQSEVCKGFPTSDSLISLSHENVADAMKQLEMNMDTIVSCGIVKMEDLGGISAGEDLSEGAISTKTEETFVEAVAAILKEEDPPQMPVVVAPNTSEEPYLKEENLAAASPKEEPVTVKQEELSDSSLNLAVVEEVTVAAEVDTPMEVEENNTDTKSNVFDPELKIKTEVKVDEVKSGVILQEVIVYDTELKDVNDADLEQAVLSDSDLKGVPSSDTELPAEDEVINDIELKDINKSDLQEKADGMEATEI